MLMKGFEEVIEFVEGRGTGGWGRQGAGGGGKEGRRRCRWREISPPIASGMVSVAPKGGRGSRRHIHGDR